MLGLKLARHGKRTPGTSEKHTHFRPQITPSGILETFLLQMPSNALKIMHLHA